MKKNLFIFFGLAALMLGMASSCSPERKGWSINGNLAGVADSTLYIEEPSGAAWIIVDSVKTDRDGNFAFTAVNPYYQGQAIYRLRLSDKAVYFPVEGTDALTLTAEGADMDMVHTLAGTPAAAGFNTVDSLINEAVNRVGETAALDDEQLLRDLGNVILTDSTCIVSYYTINRPVGRRAFFNTDNKRKLGLIGAAATRYSQLRPGDARGAELEAIFSNAKKAQRRNGSGQTLAVQAVGRPSFTFVANDVKGQPTDLNQILDRGGVTLVSLIRYDDSLSPATTAALGEAYEKYADKGLVVYQIGYDRNEAHWRQNATSMPWTTVYGPSETAEILAAFNANPIDGGPVTMVFDRNGELVNRITDPAELAAAVSALF